MKQREPRHPVAVPARVRAAKGWADVTILNLSSRGLMFRSTHRHQRGGYLELRRGSHVIVARVMWSDGTRHGARAQGIIPVADLIFDNPAKRDAMASGDRRSRPRAVDKAEIHRRLGQKLQFFAAGLGVTCAAVMAAYAAFDALRRPLAQVEVAITSAAGAQSAIRRK